MSYQSIMGMADDLWTGIPIGLFHFPFCLKSSNSKGSWFSVEPLNVMITSSILRYWLEMALHGVKQQPKLDPRVFQGCSGRCWCQGLDLRLDRTMTQFQIPEYELKSTHQAGGDERRWCWRKADPAKHGNTLARIFTGHGAIYISPIPSENEWDGASFGSW
jgi:hypothetical protein